MASTLTSAARSVIARPRAAPGIIIATVTVVVVIIFATGVLRLPGSVASASDNLPPSDVPPLEFVYLDAARVDNYLGQMEGGLSKTEQRSDQVTQAISATLSGSVAAQLAASESSQQGTQETVTPTTADRFFLFLRLLREQAPSSNVGANGSARDCPRRSGRWLWQLTEPLKPNIVSELDKCVGVGRFVRLTNVQLFLPPYAQVLPNAQSATALYGSEPWVRYPFTSTTQSSNPALIASYAREVGPDPRLPFIAASYGSKASIGPPRATGPTGSSADDGRSSSTSEAPSPSTHGLSGSASAAAGGTSVTGPEDDVAFFVPVDYQDLTTEPSLLSGAVTIVGKVVYYSDDGGPAYIDYPTISEFAPALVAQLRRKTGLMNELGVCSQLPPPLVQAQPGGRGKPSGDPLQCGTRTALLEAVKKSVTLRSPYAVILPVAIYL
jgi:hypothetical protein